jgi:hypothetical protein
MEWESVEHLGVVNIRDPEARERWMRMCRQFVRPNKKHLTQLSPDVAGQMFWHSKRLERSLPGHGFAHAMQIPHRARRALHAASQQWPVGALRLRGDEIHFEL